ncbi:MAG: helix-hairpin-helix domain-containing protein [bacterium]|nr:helix-hairpin-helix domain-containing protein [bacterium]
MNWRKNKLVKNLPRQAKKFQTSIILALVGLALIGAGLSFSKIFSSSKQPNLATENTNTKVEDQQRIAVDVEGAVGSPGVLHLTENARLEEAIKAAGGLAQNADREWVAKNLNLAAKLADGQKIYIPIVGQSPSSGGVVASEVSGKININTATEVQLDSLPDIGPVRAGKIIANRPYSKIEDLLSKKVIGEATFEKIKASITLY